MFLFALTLATQFDVTLAPMRLPQALEQLSATAGENLSCAKALDNEVVVLRLKGADKERTLQELAYCLNAKWENGTQGRILQPDAAAARREANAHQAEVAKKIAAGITEFNDVLAMQPKTFTRQYVADLKRRVEAEARGKEEAERKNKEYNGPEVDDELRPAWRALARSVLSLGAGYLRSMAIGQRTVWSEHPTPIQLPFPAALQGNLAIYRNERALFAFPGPPPARIRMVIQREEENRFMVRLIVMDASGRLVDLATENLTGVLDDKPAEESPEKPATHFKKPIEIPTDVSEFFGIMRINSTAVRDATFSKFRPQFPDPVQFEPLSAPGKVLLAAAEACDQNLVAVVPDDGITNIGYTIQGKTPSAIEQNLVRFFEVKKDWLLVPRRPDSETVARTEVKGLMTSALAKGGLSIDEAATWKAAHPASDFIISWIGDYLATAINSRGLFATRFIFDETDALDYWSLLNDATRHALRQGAVLPLASLPEAVRNRAYRDVFWSNLLNEDFPRTDLKDEDPESITRDLLDEITEQLPNGLVGGTISLTTHEFPLMIPWKKATGEPVQRTVTTAASYGTLLGNNERKGQDAGYDQFRMGVGRTYSLKIAFPKAKKSFSTGMFESFFDPMRAPVDRLPDAFFREADEARRKRLAQPVTTPKSDPVRPR